MRWFDKYTLSLLCLLLSTNFFKTFLSYQQNTNSLSSPFLVFCQIRSSSFLFFFSFFCVYEDISEGISSALLPDLKKKRRPYKTLQMMSIPLSPPLLLCRKFREWNLLQSKKLKSKLTKPCRPHQNKMRNLFLLCFFSNIRFVFCLFPWVFSVFRIVNEAISINKIDRKTLLMRSLK